MDPNKIRDFLSSYRSMCLAHGMILVCVLAGEHGEDSYLKVAGADPELIDAYHMVLLNREISAAP